MIDHYGRRIVCNVLHDRAKTKPEELFAIIAQGSDVSNGFQRVTYHQVSRAVNFMSCWLQDRFEQRNKPDRHPTLCYLGVPDIRYNIIVYAALQCGYKIFLPSPRNTPEVNVTMLQQLACSRLVYTAEVESAIKSLQFGSVEIQTEQISSVQYLLEVPDTTYPYQLTYDQNVNDPVVILHSSGSTGTPKTITWTHGTLATVDARDFPGVNGKANIDFASLMLNMTEGAPSFDVLPPFHAAGAILKFIVPVWLNRPIIYAPASRPPSGALMAQILRRLKPVGIISPPSIIEQLAQEQDSEHLFRALELVVYGGGPLSDETASRIGALTKTVNMYASTECLQVRQLEREPGELPNYIHFNSLEGLTFEQYDGDLYELVMPVSENYRATSALCHNLPHLSQFRTKDVFTRHPTKSALWKFQGRIDDILVFSSGEKLFPLPMELALVMNPKVAGALVVGNTQRQAGLLIELVPSTTLRDETSETLWPSIEAANALLPDHGRVSRDMVLLAKSNKPFKRTTKGTIIRRSTEQLYEEEIRSLYTEQLQHEQTHVTSFVPSGYRYEDIRCTLISIFQRVLPDVEISDDQNLYILGLNSIKTAEVVNQIKVSLRSARPEADVHWFNIETVYSCYSVSRLTSILHSFLNDGRLPNVRDRLQEMEAKIKKYTEDLPTSLIRGEELLHSELSVAVTGTTGFLGHYLVEKLVEIPQVSQIYCLNRSSTAREQYHQRSHTTTKKKIIFMTCKFGSSKLGLLDEQYSQLTENCSLIVHNAWAVHFGLPLDAFEDNIASVRHLIDLSAAARYRPRIHFISTYATTGVRGFTDGKPLVIPEAPIDGLELTPEIGYTEAKRVSERILETAATQSEIPATIIRLGQLVPEDGGALPTNDNLTFFLKTCRNLGAMPVDLLGPVDWIQVDVAAQILAEIVQSDLVTAPRTNVEYFNLVNHNSRSWSDFAPVLDSWCGKPLKHIGGAEWVNSLSQKGVINGDHKSLEQQISPELVKVWKEFLRRGGPPHIFEYSNLKEVSKSMCQMKTIKPESLASWLAHIDMSTVKS